MMTTMTPVMIVSRRVGHTTFLVSACTCRMNSIGVVFATVFRSPLESENTDLKHMAFPPLPVKGTGVCPSSLSDGIRQIAA
ncbi:hypothetical protein [Sphingomonas sp. MA1305]|uniref:hypothetical protein n=1 Tax=Sphingomonas sp. MA1305 TaxID=2479204 RepID=UPI002FCCE566